MAMADAMVKFKSSKDVNAYQVLYNIVNMSLLNKNKGLRHQVQYTRILFGKNKFESNNWKCQNWREKTKKMMFTYMNIFFYFAQK